MRSLVLCLFLSLFVTTATFAQSVDERRQKIISIIDEELREVRQLSKLAKGKDPNLLLRMAELNLEKARLWSEKENENYLKLPAKVRRKSKKSRYFKNSSRYYKEANRLCLSIAKRFKRYSRLSDVYYILGFNAKEFNKLKTASKYLRLANKKSKKRSKTKIKTQITLAEVYFNESKFRKAIPLYESALSKHKDKWWTKDSFNLAWSYYKVNLYSKAIRKMIEVYNASKSDRYINMKEAVQRDIALFYASANKINDGIRFYKKIGVEFTDQLIRIGSHLVAQSKLTKAREIFTKALKHERNKVKRNTINVELLVLYQMMSVYSGHKKTARRLYDSYKKKTLTKEQLSTLKFQLKKVSAILQKRAISKTYQRIKKKRNQYAKQAIEYFSMLADMEPSDKDRYHYLLAETAFFVGFKTQAFTNYKITFDTASRKKSSKFLLRSMEGMLAVLSKSRGLEKEHSISTFNLYLDKWPKGKRSYKIYERLFKNYLSRKDYKNAKRVLDRFTKNYPRDYKKQEAFIANLMEIDRRNKDHEAIKAWITDIGNKKYSVSSKYLRKLKEVLTTIQINDVQKKLEGGKKKEALVGYHKILENKNSTKKSRTNAMYNLAALYYELGDNENTFKWLSSAIKNMPRKNVKSLLGSMIVMSDHFFASLDFDRSIAMSKIILDKVCKVKSKRKHLEFKKLIFKEIAEGKVRDAEKSVIRYRKCGIKRKYINLAMYELMREFKARKEWKSYEYYVFQLMSLQRYYPRIIDELIYLENLHSKFNNTSMVSKMRRNKTRLYFKAKKNGQTLTLNTLDHFADIEIRKMKAIAGRIHIVRLQFPDKVFNMRLKNKLKNLESLVEQAQRVHAVGSGKGIINSFKVLYESSEKLAKEIEAFTPSGKSKTYIASFKKDMIPLAAQIRQSGQQHKGEGLRTILKNKILSKDNYLFHKVNKTMIPVRLESEASANLMDRRGVE